MGVIDIETQSIKHLHINDGVFAACRKIQNNEIVTGNALENVLRGCLREYMWCRMSDLHGSYIHFGYDYYVYIGLPNSALKTLLPRGIFLEECVSPYMEEEPDAE